jgi:uncharacterized Ntn-hydrolase superfamily protein
MGAWGIGNFDNDDAADWVYELTESDGTDVLMAALQAATSEGYLQAPIASAALAAAEVVAGLLGNAGKALPDEVRKWVADNEAEVSHDLLALSRAAVMRVKEDSELRELFQDSDDYEQWVSLQDDLLKRLGAG